MSYFPKITILALVFFITLGLAISLQGVLGINIGSNLDLGNLFKITKVVTPTDSGDVATKGWVESIVVGGVPVSTGLYGICNYCSSCPVNRCLAGFLPPFTGCTDAGGFSCPGGYTVVQTGHWEAFNTVNLYSCYKN